MNTNDHAAVTQRQTYLDWGTATTEERRAICRQFANKNRKAINERCRPYHWVHKGGKNGDLR